MAFVRFLRLSSSAAISTNKNVYHLRNPRFLSSSPLLSAAVQKSPASKPPPPKPSGRKDPLDTSFNDPIAAFKSKTTFELIRGYMVYLICSSETLVENNMKVRIF